MAVREQGVTRSQFLRHASPQPLSPWTCSLPNGLAHVMAVMSALGHRRTSRHDAQVVAFPPKSGLPWSNMASSAKLEPTGNAGG